MDLKILKIKILCFSGMDEIVLTTELPSGVFPFTGNADLTLKVAHGIGEKYAEKHFPNLTATVIVR
jgi:hypothetical protein